MEGYAGKSELLSSCDSRFHKYVRRVLDRVPEEIRYEKLLHDPGLKILSFDGENLLGFQAHFDSPVTDLIFLNKSLLRKPALHIVHTIAHEFAHKVACKSETGLHEMDAEELLREWGFIEESDAVSYHRPIWETEGFKIGHDWAQEHDLTEFEEFYDEWNDNRLTSERWQALNYLANPMDILRAMGYVSELGRDEDSKPPEDAIEDTDGTIDRAVVMGIMQCLREKKEKSLEAARAKDYQKTEFLEQLKRAYFEIGKVFDMTACPDYIHRLPYVREVYSELYEFLESPELK